MDSFRFVLRLGNGDATAGTPRFAGDLEEKQNCHRSCGGFLHAVREQFHTSGLSLIVQRCEQGLLLDARAPFQFVLAFERVRLRGEALGVHERDRPPARRVFRAAAGVVRVDAPVQIDGVARVQRSVHALDDVDVMHAMIVASRKFLSVHTRAHFYVDTVRLRRINDSKSGYPAVPPE